MSLTEAMEHVKQMLRSICSDFLLFKEGEGNVDVRIPTQADTDAWIRQQEEGYKRKCEQWVVKRKKHTLPRLKKEISDVFLRQGECELLLEYSSVHQECICAMENWEDLSSWATHQGVVLWLSDDKYDNLRLGRYRILTGKIAPIGVPYRIPTLDEVEQAKAAGTSTFTRVLKQFKEENNGKSK